MLTKQSINLLFPFSIKKQQTSSYGSKFFTKIRIFKYRAFIKTLNLLFRLIFNKKNIIFYIFLTILTQKLSAQTAITIGGLGGDEATEVVVHQDNIIVGGTFQQELGTASSHGGSDAFLQQYDLQGQLLWQYSLHSIFNVQLNAIYCSTNGNIYSTGIFSDSLFIGEQQDTVIYSQQQAIFIIKQDQQGQLIWAKTLQGKALNTVKDIVIDAQENSYITGTFQDTFSFGSSNQLIGTKNTPFLIKLNATGEPLWGQRPAFVDEAEGIALALNDQGQVYWAGQFKGFFALTTDTVQAHWVFNDLFLTKLDTNGNYLLQQHYGGVYNNTCKRLEWNAGKLYLGGSFTGVLDIDSLRLVTPFRQFDAFLVQLNPDGTPNWGVQSQTIADCFFEGIAFYKDQLIFSGNYKDSFQWQQQQFSAIAEQDIFQITLDSNGQTIEVNTWLGTGFDLIKANAIHSSGQRIAVGGFQETLTVDSLVLAAQGFSDAFLVIEPNLTTALTSISSFELVEITLHPNPSKDSTTITCSVGTFKQWILYNMSGQIIATGSKKTIPLSKLASGTYSLQVQTTNGLGIKKLVVP